MSTETGGPPIIIKRKKIVGGDGHHGGAWKVAYADFVTAMMAFFMLMWLLSATTEKQRKGLADYFSPVIPISRVSGGGGGLLKGNSQIFQNIQEGNSNGTPARIARPGRSSQNGDQTITDTTKQTAAAKHERQQAQLNAVVRGLLGREGRSVEENAALDHIRTRLTDEGLVIEMFDLEGKPLFVGDTPTPIMKILIGIVSKVAGMVENRIAVGGHLESQPIVTADRYTWELSYQRANVVRQMMIAAQMRDRRFQRIVGHSDRERGAYPINDVRNNRVEIVLLRNDV